MSCTLFGFSKSMLYERSGSFPTASNSLFHPSSLVLPLSCSCYSCPFLPSYAYCPSVQLALLLPSSPTSPSPAPAPPAPSFHPTPTVLLPRLPCSHPPSLLLLLLLLLLPLPSILLLLSFCPDCPAPILLSPYSPSPTHAPALPAPFFHFTPTVLLSRLPCSYPPSLLLPLLPFLLLLLHFSPVCVGGGG